MKNVLITIENFPPDYTGAGLRASRLVGRLNNNYNINFKVLCLSHSGQTSNNKKNKEKSITRLNLPNEDGWLFPFYVLFTFFKVNLYFIKNSKKIDIIHFFSFSWFNRIIMLSNILFYKKKTILEVTLDGSDDPESLIKTGKKNKLFSRFTKFLLKRINKFLVPSENSLISCQKCRIDINKVWLRPHPVDEQIFGTINLNNKDKLRSKLKLPDKYILLSVGVFCSRKNQLFLAKTINNSKNKDLVLVLIGPKSKEEPDYLSKLENYIKKNNLQKQIIIINEESNIINEYLIASDLFVFASKSEGFPNVIAEAITSGLPILSLNLSGLDKLITKETGIIVNQNSNNENSILKEYSKQLSLIFSKKVRFDKPKIRKEGLFLFSSKIIDEKYFKLYKSLLAEKVKNEQI